jgi:hypothetical protein
MINARTGMNEQNENCATVYNKQSDKIISSSGQSIVRKIKQEGDLFR